MKLPRLQPTDTEMVKETKMHGNISGQSSTHIRGVKRGRSMGIGQK